MSIAHEATLRRQFQLMTKHLAKHIRPIVEPWQVERAGTNTLCHFCGLEYVEHPEAPEGASVTVLCSGKRVKL